MSREASPGSGRHWSSRLLHSVGDLGARSGAGLTAAALMVGWAIVGVATQFPGWWETVLYSVSGAVTLVMVFVIQHTQARQITAIQRKLDEVVRSAPLADDALIAIEVAADAEFRAIVDRVEGRERVADPLEEASQDDANPDAPST